MLFSTFNACRTFVFGVVLGIPPSRKMNIQQQIDTEAHFGVRRAVGWVVGWWQFAWKFRQAVDSKLIPVVSLLGWARGDAARRRRWDLPE